jgi:hypothetical protein
MTSFDPKIKKWLALSRDELDRVYRDAEAGTIPRGDSRAPPSSPGRYWLRATPHLPACSAGRARYSICLLLTVTRDC